MPPPERKTRIVPPKKGGGAGTFVLLLLVLLAGAFWLWQNNKIKLPPEIESKLPLAIRRLKSNTPSPTKKPTSVHLSPKPQDPSSLKLNKQENPSRSSIRRHSTSPKSTSNRISGRKTTPTNKQNHKQKTHYTAGTSDIKTSTTRTAKEQSHNSQAPPYRYPYRYMDNFVGVPAVYRVFMPRTTLADSLNQGSFSENGQAINGKHFEFKTSPTPRHRALRHAQESLRRAGFTQMNVAIDDYHKGGSTVVTGRKNTISPRVREAYVSFQPSDSGQTILWSVDFYAD